MLTGRVGQPALIRVANVGLANHSPHIHGNHLHLLSEDAQVRDNVLGLDTWRVPPMSTTDVLHPFIRPPDAWPWPPSDPTVFTTALAGHGTPGLVYPMHCHTELGVRANGGNYPQGVISHWVLTGDLEGPNEPPEDPEGPQDPEDPGDPENPEGPEEPGPPPTGGGPRPSPSPGEPTDPAGSPRPTPGSRRPWEGLRFPQPRRGPGTRRPVRRERFRRSRRRR